MSSYRIRLLLSMVTYPKTEPLGFCDFGLPNLYTAEYGFLFYFFQKKERNQLVMARVIYERCNTIVFRILEKENLRVALFEMSRVIKSLNDWFVDGLFWLLLQF